MNTPFDILPVQIKIRPTYSTIRKDKVGYSNTRLCNSELSEICCVDLH